MSWGVVCGTVSRSGVQYHVSTCIRGSVDLLCDCSCDFVWELYVGMFPVVFV